MSSNCCRWLVAVLMASTMVGRTFAQETPAGAEEAAEKETTYHDLRRSKNRATKSAADRYFYLIRAQEWTSLNGKSKVTAKYVAHDPDLKWVKLSTVRGSGANRVTREVTVDLAKLNKACQSRVKQIDTLQKKLDELKVSEQEDANQQAGGEGYGGYGAPMTDERGAEPARGAETPSVDPTAGNEGANDRGYGGYPPSPETPRGAAPPAAQPSPIDSSDPDPLGFGDMENESPPAAATDERGIGAPSSYRPYGGAPQAAPAAGADAEGRVDRSQWKTNYAAFLANFTATPLERGEPTIDWGELGDLRGMHDAVVAALERGDNNAYGQHTSEFQIRLGEVRWSAPFKELGQPLDTGEQEVLFDLAPLPEPLKLRFVIDLPNDVEKFRSMRPDETVEFIGQFDVKKPREILVRIRLPE
jgi:hypothetical protein